MLHIDFSPLLALAEQNSPHGLHNSELKRILADFSQLEEKLQSRGQGFLDLPNQGENVTKIQEFAQKASGKYTDLVVLGIGGSMLGPQTILQALGVKTGLKVHCLDNIDPQQIADLAQKLPYSKTLFLVQTKSGATPETVAQYLFFQEKVEAQNLTLKEHFVFVTDPKKGYLRQLAAEKDIPSFPIPENVGGRFSVLSSVGLVLSALCGHNIEKMLLGAQKALQEGQKKAALQLAYTQFLLLQKGKNITVLMPYASSLRLLAPWYTQLLSESLGKENNLRGEKVNVGLTPVPALGATDQHSQLQLFAQGPNDKLIIFVEVENFKQDLLISKQIPAEFNFLQNKTFDQLLAAELVGTRRSLTENERPNLTLKINQVNEENLGALFMFLQLSVAYLGEMLEVNTFDQPGVERSKVLAREILESK